MHSDWCEWKTQKLLVNPIGYGLQPTANSYDCINELFFEIQIESNDSVKKERRGHPLYPKSHMAIKLNVRMTEFNWKWIEK